MFGVFSLGKFSYFLLSSFNGRVIKIIFKIYSIFFFLLLSSCHFKDYIGSNVCFKNKDCFRYSNTILD